MAKCDAATVAIGGTANVGVMAPGAEAKVVSVATTTTAEEVAVVVEAKEMDRVLVVAQNVAKSVTNRYGGRSSGGGLFNVGRVVHFLPLVFGIDHGQWPGGRGNRQEVSRATSGEHFGLWISHSS